MKNPHSSGIYCLAKFNGMVLAVFIFAWNAFGKGGVMTVSAVRYS